MAITNSFGFYEVLMDAAALVLVKATLSSGYLSLTPNPVGATLPDGSLRRADFGLLNAANLPCNSNTNGIVNGFVYSDTLSDGNSIIGADQPTLANAKVSVPMQTQSINWM